MKKLTRVILSIIAVLVVVIPIRFAMLGHRSGSGDAPGLRSGTLTPCPDKPNCVSSESGEDAEHAIAPLDTSGARSAEAWGDVLQVIEELGGAIVVSDDDYIAATFSSSIFGFVDDVECRLDAAQQKIQIRSASRVGHSDMGVNRKRVKKLTRSFDQRRGDAS